MDKYSLTSNFLRSLFGENHGLVEYQIMKTINGVASIVEQVFCETLNDAISGSVLNTLMRENAFGCDIYFGALPRVSRSGHQEDIRYITTLWSDLNEKDYKKGKAEALQRLHAFPIEPSVIVDSGSGYHSYWILKNAIPNNNPDFIRGIINGIGIKLGANPILDLRKTLRLPSSKCWNGKEIPIGCDIIEKFYEPERRYRIKMFENFYVDPDSDAIL